MGLPNYVGKADIEYTLRESGIQLALLYYLSREEIKMAKRKISGKRGFSFENMPQTKLKKGTRLVSHDSSKKLADVEFVSQALIQALKDGDADAFKEILGAHLSVTNKEKFSERAKIPKRTLFRMLSPSGNPTLENVARIVHALSKAA